MTKDTGPRFHRDYLIGLLEERPKVGLSLLPKFKSAREAIAAIKADGREWFEPGDEIAAK